MAEPKPTLEERLAPLKAELEVCSPQSRTAVLGRIRSLLWVLFELGLKEKRHLEPVAIEDVFASAVRWEQWIEGLEAQAREQIRCEDLIRSHPTLQTDDEGRCGRAPATRTPACTRPRFLVLSQALRRVADWLEGRP